MKDLIILGAGGMGRQVYSCFSRWQGYADQYRVKGFLDDNLEALKDYPGYPPVLGRIDDYKVQEGEVFFNSIGDVQQKRKCVDKIHSQGGQFINLIHPSVDIPKETKIGQGCLIGPRVGIGVESEIGDFCLIQNGVVIGHDVKVGNYVRLDCYVVCIAGVEISDNACIHTASVLNHNVKVGQNATVGACSFVIRNVKPGTTVFGNPAKKIVNE